MPNSSNLVSVHTMPLSILCRRVKDGVIVTTLYTISCVFADKGLMVWVMAFDKAGKIGKYLHEELEVVTSG